MNKLITLCAVLLACGPKPKPAEVPMLPGDGEVSGQLGVPDGGRCAGP